MSRRTIDLAALCGALAALACGSEPAYVEPPPPAVTVARPVVQSVTDYLEVTGTVEAVERVEIRARVEGFLQSVEFVEGEFVEAGDLLYRIDPREFEATLAQARATVQTAQAGLDLADATLARRKRAAATGAVSELEVLQSRAERDAARAQLQYARAQVDRAELDVSYTAIHAPISGRIGDNLVDVGNLVGAGENTLLSDIVVYDPINVFFTINERALLRLADAARERSTGEGKGGRLEGIAIEAARSTDEGYPFEGQLDLTDEGVDRTTGTLLVRAVFDNPAPVRLFPGLFIRGRLPLRDRTGVMLVPERALGADQSGRYLLIVDDDDVVQYRAVTVGALIDGMRVIDDGIEPNDRVVTQGVLYARPGAKVAPELETKQAASAGS